MPSLGEPQYTYCLPLRIGFGLADMRSDSRARGIYKRRRHDGEYWAYRFQHKGKSYSATTGFKATQKLLPAARRALDEHLQHVRRGTELEDRPPVRFTDAAERFLEWSEGEHRDHPATAKRQGVSLASARKMFSDFLLAEITAGDIETYKTSRRKAKIAEVTIRKDLLALSQLFQFGVRHGWVSANPVKDVELPSDADSLNERTINPEEETLYFSEAALENPVLHDVGRLMIFQGLRPEECLGLTQDDIALDTRRLEIRGGKSRASRRELYIHENVLPILRARLAKPFYHLFPGGRWEYNGRHYSYSGLIKAHWAVFDELNREGEVLEPFDIYSFRHTFATRFYEATKDLDKLARILGHANLATVRRYVNPSREDLRTAMKVFEGTCNFSATKDAGLSDNRNASGNDRPNDAN